MNQPPYDPNSPQAQQQFQQQGGQQQGYPQQQQQGYPQQQQQGYPQQQQQGYPQQQQQQQQGYPQQQQGFGQPGMQQQGHNPYAAPQHQGYPQQGHFGMQQQGTHPPCPKCGHTFAKAASFTWWGGILGPKLFSHVNCLQCNAGYNGKSGKSNNTAIAIYMVVLTSLSLGLIVMVNL